MVTEGIRCIFLNGLKLWMSVPLAAAVTVPPKSLSPNLRDREKILVDFLPEKKEVINFLYKVEK